ncbi:calfacilitin isoform X2 [Numida meleagris]|uniref:calfacilitin isoform X2 n=1 Tax=Numida meleagris TaxID=8996 RepID=UPI000B3E034C|nr:calfacilitin isoform X2 [Numida meleagris]
MPCAHTSSTHRHYVQQHPVHICSQHPSAICGVGACDALHGYAMLSMDMQCPVHTHSLWQSPELLSDIQDGYSVSGHLLVCFSSGYFIHDSLDIIFNQQSRSSWEYLVHHAMAISAFVSLIITGRFLVAAMLLLLVEVSNIFLTIRMLLKMSNVPSPALYEANKYVNLVMYFAFRLAPQAYLTWYFVRYVEVQGQGAFLMANLLLLDAMILMYFSRLLRSDFFPSLRKGSAGRDVDGEKFLID